MNRRYPATAFLCAVLVVSAVFVACTGRATSRHQGDGAHAMTDRGEASYYADKFVGRKTASGEVYKHGKLTAAHRTLPFGTRVRVRRLDTNAEVTVRINDRGPFKRGRIIDLSRSAARKIGLLTVGVADVELQVLDGVASGPKTDPAPDRGSGGTSTSW